MATATVVTAQEIDAVITYQEQIEQERERSEQEFNQRRKEYEEKRLNGKSHWAIARKFARGATSGKGSRVFIEGNKIYSFGRHFVLATRKEEGDWGCGLRFIVNGDRYSSSTSGHTNLVIHACKSSVQIPFSALDAAGLTQARFGTMSSPIPICVLWLTKTTSGTRYVVYVEEMSIQRGQSIVAMKATSAFRPMDNRRGRHEHIFGGVIIELCGKYYLSAIDQNEPWRLRAYFFCELPGTPGSIAEAYDSLSQQVRDAESAGINVRRQGDIFLIRLTERDWNPQLQYGRDTLAKDHRLWGGTHRASTALITNGRTRR
jgi:hypothetical protein